jgi:tetratricopeptide (TPR) repeat protein
MKAFRSAFGAPPAPASSSSAFGRPPAHADPPSTPAMATATSAPADAAPSEPKIEQAAPQVPPDRGSGRNLAPDHNSLKTKILTRAEQITSQDYFQMLGLGRDASPEEVQKAFIALAKVWHPDRLPTALASVKDACSKVFSHLTEAQATLTDASKREQYMMLLKDGGATPDDQAKIQAIVEAATEFQKAEFLLKRNPSDPKAYEIITRCVSLDDQPDYLATLAWLEAQRPEAQEREKLLEKIAILDQCIDRSPRCERAFFYRGMLYKRAEEPARALEDFKRAAALNPRNLDAMREVRIYNMRQAASAAAANTGRASKPPPSDKRGGGLFGKLFKK